MDSQESRSRAYDALNHAASQVGSSNYRAGLYRTTYYGNGRVRTGYTITPEHRELIEAMPKVLSGEMGVDDAMALVTRYDIMVQRFS